MLKVGPKKKGTSQKSIFSNCKAPLNSLKVCVIVPAKDEAESIVETLDALRMQWVPNGRRLSFDVYEVLLLANNCSDNTFDIATDYALCNPDFNLHVFNAKIPASKANIGYVRRILMDEACRRLTMYGSTDGIIASTDGDTVADKCWISTIMKEIAMGSDAVGGRILTNNINDSARLYYLRDMTYRILSAKAAALIDPEKNNPWPCHHQYFGASLAITCSMYDYCGRLPGVPHLEDMALYNALIKVDAKIRCSPDVKVYTSGRTDGRVDIGFSEQLKTWTEHNSTNTPQLVEPAACLLIKLKAKKILRICYEAFNDRGVIEKKLIGILAAYLFINKKWIEKQLQQAKHFGECWQALEEALDKGKFYDNYEPVLITQAIAELRSFFRSV